MDQLDISLSIANEYLGSSVVRINPNAREEFKEKEKDCHFFGIKNSADISDVLIDRLRHHPSFLWLSIDKMADRGSSIDSDIINPLTYRFMTGSSSGGCVNIVKGINELAIGSDGGGSVIAPALSTNLFSFMGKGCGLVIDKTSVSTDRLSYQPAVGIIAADFDIMKTASEIMCQMEFNHEGRPIRVMIPAAESMMLPGGKDAYRVIKSLPNSFLEEYTLREHSFKSPFDRPTTVTEVMGIFQRDETDLILSYEGPIDVFGYDSTPPKYFEGPAVEEVTGTPGKAMAKVANMCGCSAITVPGSELAAGFVITCGGGSQKAAMGFYLADKLRRLVPRPEGFLNNFSKQRRPVRQSSYK
ncbi:MAG: amidase family protein [Defluviitaleaceae bacterium]|nr:amidase family protein [Defluviitaleaceae bacterium]